MMADYHDFARALLKELSAQIVSRTEALASGTCKTFDEYQRLTGEIRGLTVAHSETQALLEKAREHE